MQQRLLSALAVSIWALGAHEPARGLEIPAAPPSPARLGPEELAVIINDLDPLSRKIGEYYQSQRHIPETNIIHLRFEPEKPNLSHAEFNRLNTEVNRKTPARVQAYAWHAQHHAG